MSHYASDTPKTFVLCFDGTGNKFKGDDSDSNVLKIFRMLDREGQQFHYYQPGIGTYVSSTTVGSSGVFSRIKHSFIKAKDSAIGSSFAHHVLGGYRFLMRYYSPGDDIYFFGFSRGAYTARFLAEMLDFIGLLSIGNEELVQFAWQTFAKWQQRGDDSEEDITERQKLFCFMKAFRETFSRPVERIRFLGLFDTVNSVPKFESPWMERSRFPYTARSTAKVIRHAVGIDERRAKFRQDLISENQPSRKRAYSRNPPPHEKNGTKPSNGASSKQSSHFTSHLSTFQSENRYRPSHRRYPVSRRSSLPIPTHEAPADSTGPTDEISPVAPAAPDTDSVESDQSVQDIQEVWFPGGHADIGGGWNHMPGEIWPLSHAPLVWMVHEAERAGLQFDERKLKQFECAVEFEGEVTPILSGWEFHQTPPKTQPEIKIEGEPCTEVHTNGVTHQSDSCISFHRALELSSTKGHLHDCLSFKAGLSTMSVLSWNVMEYLPFKRMDLQEDGSWTPIRWPLPRGEVRDIPLGAHIHNSAIRRMKADPKYRPGNLIIGGGGRGVKKAPKALGMGAWVVSDYEGDMVRETYVRESLSKNGSQKNGVQNNGGQ
ncbi:hypothetical protein FQN53_005244 [Emmonsiellopsis sp. PD_33]|nr:hypothetical protein FQN53_005244 [Emmonsiellopsis sp. PD_33]